MSTGSLILYINPNNVYVHNKYQGDHTSGYDIALIGIEKEHHIKLEQLINNNKSYQ